MNAPSFEAKVLDLKAVSILTGLCMLWGFNAVAIKVSNLGIAPVFSAGIRSVIAVIALTIWMKVKKIPLFPSNVPDGLVVGLLFGTEFACLYASFYIKRRLLGSVSFHHTLFYQTIFSIPILFLISVLLNETPVDHLDGVIVLSIVFQGIVVAFVSYLLWFYLVHGYSVSRLSAFTFLTPVFATISCVIFLHEPLTWKLVMSLMLVSMGIYVVNR